MLASSASAQDLPAQAALATDAPTPGVPPEEAKAAESAPRESERAQDDSFAVSFTPYMWLTSLSGDLGIRGANVNVDASFFDIVDEANTVFGLMGGLEFQWDRIIVQFNAAWTYTEGDGERGVVEDVKLKADITAQTAWLELLGGYRILDRGMAEINDKRRFTFDVFGGGRLTVIDTEIDATLKGSVTLPDGTPVSGSVSQDFDDEEVWGEPFVGLRVGIDFTERFALSLRGDIGGFGVSGSEFSWQTIGGLGYTFHAGTWNGAAIIGFRALSQDYENGDFKWDIITYGPILGVQFTF